MSERPERGVRVLLVLGQSAARDDALSAAVAVAARLSAELDTLFIEDEDLVRAASLPTGSHLIWGRDAPEAIEVGSVLRSYRALAERARAAIEREARRLQVASSFRVTRGARSSELARAFEEGDVLMFAAARPPSVPPPAPRSERTTRAPQNAPVRVLVDGTAAGDRALEVARSLANASHPLEIWVPASRQAPSAALLERVRAQVGRAIPIREHAPVEPTREQAMRMLSAAAGGTLVVPESTELARVLTSLSREVALPCWVVITR